LDVGLSDNWELVDGSTDTNQVVISIDEDDELRMYRLAYPDYSVINTNL
jgi:hypothetical protein